jgi:hypothetical protein
VLSGLCEYFVLLVENINTADTEALLDANNEADLKIIAQKTSVYRCQDVRMWTKVITSRWKDAKPEYPSK